VAPVYLSLFSIFSTVIITTGQDESCHISYHDLFFFIIKSNYTLSTLRCCLIQWQRRWLRPRSTPPMVSLQDHGKWCRQTGTIKSPPQSNLLLCCRRQQQKQQERGRHLEHQHQPGHGRRLQQQQVRCRLQQQQVCRHRDRRLKTKQQQQHGPHDLHSKKSLR